MTRAKQCTRSVPTLTYMSTSYVHPPSPPMTLPSLCLTAPCAPHPSRYHSSSIPSSDALSSQLHIGSACSVPECTCPTLPGRHPGAESPPPRLTPSHTHSPGLPAGDGAIDALHRVTKLEAKRKALKYLPRAS